MFEVETYGVFIGYTQNMYNSLRCFETGSDITPNTHTLSNTTYRLSM